MGKYTPQFSLEEIFRQQGVRARSAKEMYGDFVPEEDSVDDFLEMLREIGGDALPIDSETGAGMPVSAK